MVKTKEHQILFSTDNVKAILDGRKTMTRRVIKPQPELDAGGYYWNFYTKDGGRIRATLDLENKGTAKIRFCPYGQVGDRLWVRETWLDYAGMPVYKADKSVPEVYHWKPSIFMPRWASRITLEITEVRVERLQEITSVEIQKEGVGWYAPRYFNRDWQTPFAVLWDSLNAKRGYGWDTNPWVWTISFKIVLW